MPSAHHCPDSIHQPILWVTRVSSENFNTDPITKINGQLVPVLKVLFCLMLLFSCITQVHAAEDSVYLWKEAEGNFIIPPIFERNDPLASGNTFVYVPSGYGFRDETSVWGKVFIPFSIPKTGNYALWGRFLAPTGNENSFWVSFDGNNLEWWYADEVPYWKWGKKGIYSLNEGSHQLVVKWREAGTKLDKVLLTNDLSYIPVGKGNDEQPTPTPTPVPSPSPTPSPTNPPVIPKPVASFTASPTSGIKPLAVQFTDTSTGEGITSWAWDVNNDGTVDYTTRNPQHTYTAGGKYSVKLTVTGTGGSNSVTRTDLVSCTEEYFGAEANPTGSPIGGGTGYRNIISRTDSRVKFLVSTKDQLLNALKNARAGDVVYIEGTANIDMTGAFKTQIPAGVTLASNRGENGAPGGRLYMTRSVSSSPDPQIWWQGLLYAKGENVRLTGLRIEGPDKGTDEPAYNQAWYAIRSDYRNIEVDNCEIYGWSNSGIDLWYKGDSTGIAGNFHHNYIHHIQSGDNAGYGVDIVYGTALIEANRFDYTRHSIACSGYAGTGYEARYNLNLEHSTSHVFDMHEYSDPATGKFIAGDWIKIHHNTVLVTNQYTVGIRAIPRVGAWIDHNWFQMYGNEPPVYQYNGKENVYMTNNLIGPNKILYDNGPISR